MENYKQMKRIYIFGTGRGSDTLEGFLKLNQVKIIAYIDNNKGVQGSYKRNIPIIGFEEIEPEFDAIVLSMVRYDDVKRQILESGREPDEKRILAFYDERDLSKEIARDVLKYEEWMYYLLNRKFSERINDYSLLFGMVMDVVQKQNTKDNPFSKAAILNKLNILTTEEYRKSAQLASYYTDNAFKVDMVTTWNARCGIAEYAHDMVDSMSSKASFTILADKDANMVYQDDNRVHRIWKKGSIDMTAVTDYINSSPSEIVHIQYHRGLFGFDALLKMVQSINKKTIVEFHNTQYIIDNDYSAAGLNESWCCIVHQEKDIHNLKKCGVEENKIVLLQIPVGLHNHKTRTTAEARAMLGFGDGVYIGTTGFMFAHKGIKRIIEAIPLLKKEYGEKIFFLAPCASNGHIGCEYYYGECMEAVYKNRLENNVSIITEFLPAEHITLLLQACDVLLLPYDYSPESSSAAVRSCIAAERPLILTDYPIFYEWRGKAYMIENNSREEISNAVKHVMDRENKNLYVIEQLFNTWDSVVSLLIKLYGIGGEEIK